MYTVEIQFQAILLDIVFIVIIWALINKDSLFIYLFIFDFKIMKLCLKNVVPQTNNKERRIAKLNLI